MGHSSRASPASKSNSKEIFSSTSLFRNELLTDGTAVLTTTTPPAEGGIAVAETLSINTSDSKKVHCIVLPTEDTTVAYP